jgi:hypothetical protein
MISTGECSRCIRAQVLGVQRAGIDGAARNEDRGRVTRRTDEPDRRGEERQSSVLLYGSLAVLAILVVVFTMTNVVPRGARVWLPPIGVLFLAAIPFAPRARTDPVWYASVVGPGLLATIVAPALPWPINLALSMAGVLFVLPFLVGPQVLTNWWWSTVLRRPIWSRGRWFNAALSRELGAWADALAGEGELTPSDAADAHEALMRIRALDPPTPAWAAVRDDYLTEGERWIATPRDHAHQDEWADLQARLDALDDRRRQLRDLG